MHSFEYNAFMDETIINENALHNLREAIGEEALQNFLQRFLTDCAERTERINHAYQHARFTEVELEAHTLGSSAATYGALKLEEVCREIEFAKPSKNAAFEDRIKRLNMLSEQSMQALREFSA